MTVLGFSGGIFDFDSKQLRLTEVRRELEQPNIWDNPQRAQELGRERARLEAELGTLQHLDSELSQTQELLELARGRKRCRSRQVRG